MPPSCRWNSFASSSSLSVAKRRIHFCQIRMKTATDFLVQRKITNLYVYVVDNKKDNIWESSMSVFYTKSLKKVTDYIYELLV